MSYTNSDKPRPVRSRALTERGRLYEIGECQRRRSQLEAKIRTQLLVVETLIEDNRVDKLSEEIQLTENLFTEYSRVHSKCQILIQSGVEEDDAHSTESIDRRFNSIRRKVSELLDSSSKSERKTDRQSKSKSLKSSRKGSSIRSIASHIAKEKARIAELQVEAEFAQEQQRLEQDARNLTLRLEMAKAEAKLQAYQSSDIEDCSQNLDDLPAEVDKSQKVADYINRHLLSVNDVSRQNEGIVPPVDQSVDGGDHQDQDHQEEDQPSRKSTKVNARTLEVKLGRRQNVPQSIQREDNPFAVRPPIDQMYGLTHLINHLQAPTVEIDTFSGNCIDYPYFITTFIEVVETRISDPRGRLIRLLKYLDEEAKELVQACVYLPADEGYKKARQLLEKNYGDQYRILSEYRKELRSWPKLKPDDGRAFKKFYSFLVKYKSTMQCVSKSSRYDSPELVQRLQLCLPSFLQARWNRRSYTIRKATREEAGIDIFIDFMEEEMLLVNDPNFSRNALADLKEDTPRPTTMQTTQKRFKTMLTKNSITCPKCSNDHDLDDCEEYLKLNRFDRRNFVFRSRLCFSCYSPTGEGHNGMTCKNKRKCAICNEAHPTGLHGYQRKKKPPDEKQNKAVNVNCSKLQSEVISLNVVPVKITHPSSSVEIFTKALLDTGSQGTFIHEKILKDLHVQTTPTSISIKTVNGESTEKCQTISKLQISAVKDPDNKLCLPKVYSRPFIPVDKEEIPTPSKVAKWKYLDEIHPHLQHDDDAEEVGILIGANCPRALEPLETIPSQGSGPYAFRSVLGWCVTGPIINKVPSTSKQRCNFVSIANNNIRFVMQDEIKEQGLGEMMLKMFQQDFSENNKVGESENLSINDKKFLRIMDENVKLIDGHYQLPLPFKKQIMDVPNNKSLAIKRVFSLKKKLQTNKKMHEDYCTFMKNIFDKGFAEKCDSSSENGKTWYLPHHGVYHPKKPNKIRVVFDCSAKYGGVSLNSLLLQGPDLTNQIIGVLTRFREDQVALVGDIESMFYQVRVPKDQRDMLRFVWWPEGDLSAELQEYQMCVHLFGGTHSPSTCNYALRKTAKDNTEEFGEEAASTLINNFYVDDMLKSAPDVPSTLHLLKNVKQMCAAGGFPLSKFVTSSREVLQTIPSKERSKEVKDINFDEQILPIERALGVSWCIENDSFCFRIVLKDAPLTRRGILASVSSVYDPLGFGAPFILPVKQLLQQLCAEQKDWDDKISGSQRATWERWRNSLHLLTDVRIRRCIRPEDFGEVCDASLHHFSDAATGGYGQVSYLRLVNARDEVHCCFMMGKARVTPLKPVTVPRLELTAATTSTKVATQLKKELTLKWSYEVFWTDSQVVLGYIKNQTKKFHLFVANRIQAIRDVSEEDQWRYVQSSDNPADDGTRGQTVANFVKSGRWLSGPKFLLQPRDSWGEHQTFEVDGGDVEVKKVKVNTVSVEENDQLQKLVNKTSNWYRLKRVVATMLSWRYKKKIDVDLLQKAEVAIIRFVQQEVFKVEWRGLLAGDKKRKLGSLSRLSPFLDSDSIVRVGGRIDKSSSLDWIIKHPIILPKNHPITVLVIRHFHEKVHHGGRDATLNEIRQRGFMIVNASSRVRNEIYKCVTCRRLRGKMGDQRMADLPEERCSEAAPFTYTGVDMFGPFVIKEGRKELKRYGAIFTCLSSRSIHLESTNSLETDSFILALRRFINRRGEVRQMRSDNGTNFVGASKELQKAVKEMDQMKITDFLLQHNTDWLGWEFNTPTASHMGGVWERQIRSCRSILSSLLNNHGQSLNDECFRTVLTEVEAIVNSRPLSVESLNDSDSLTPLTPNLLLTAKSKIVMAPPGDFNKSDIYSRRRWRRVQHLVDEFWCRWRTEYLQSLQARNKWQLKKRNFVVGDVVILKDEGVQRNEWRLARVTEAHQSEGGDVRSVVVQTSTGKNYTRPITKIVLLVEAE